MTSSNNNWFSRNFLSKSHKASLPELPYTALSPINDVTNEHYMNALQWALTTDTIQNIALTGPYGSGKSSVIRTFEDKHQKEGFTFLDISLATFKEEKPVEGQKETSANEQEILNRIEASILQQIFYREKAKKIPDSRFKKIIGYSETTIFGVAVLLSIWAISFIFFFYPSIFHTLFSFRLLGEWHNYWIFNNLLPHLLLYTSSFFILYQSMRSILRSKLTKVKVFDNEVEMDSSTNKSILNQHIDEIIYFFKQTPYNVVIIEDLDRFNQPEIFTKLREINTILNKSKEIKRKIVFLYAVRDDMFTDKARAKFFDFIIPIIPIINYSNSSEKLRTYGLKHQYTWEDNLVDDIALFVDDMRLLHNVTNEFHVYHKTLSSTLSSSKLLALLVYKNIYPDDFVSLSEGKGILFEAIQNKEIFIKEKVNKLISKIDSLKQNIEDIRHITLKNEKELKSLYIFELLKGIQGFNGFIHQGNVISIEEAINNNFYLVKSNNLKVRVNQGGYYYEQQQTYSFSDLEKIINPEFSFDERLNQLKSSTTTHQNQLKEEINKLQLRIRELNSTPIKELLNEAGNIQLSSDIRQNQFLLILLRSGYIDESYIDYISIFYEGSLSRVDYEFILSVKSQKPQPSFSVQLTNLAKVCAKLSPADFSQPACFNISLVKYLVTEDKEEDKLEKLFKQFERQTEIPAAFLQLVLQDNVMPPVFYAELINRWEFAWPSVLSEDSLYTDIARNNLFLAIVEFVPIPVLKGMRSKESFTEELNRSSEIFGLIPDKDRVKEVVDALDVRFEYLNDVFFEADIAQYIYEGNHYQINDSMIKLLLKKLGKLDEEAFATRNYSAICETKLQKLIDYINSSINEYVAKVFLKLSDNSNENIDAYVWLLSSPALNFSVKQQIVRKTNTKIVDVSKIDEPSLVSYLLINNKIESTWLNLLSAYQIAGNNISDDLIKFLSLPNSTFTLNSISKEEVDSTDDSKNFIDTILQDNRVPDSAYLEICTKQPFGFSYIPLNKLSVQKVSTLIDTGTLIFNPKSFDSVYTKDQRLAVVFLRENLACINSGDAKLELTLGQLSAILQDDAIPHTAKQILINTSREELESNDIASLNQLLLFLIENPVIDVRDSIVKTVLLESKLSTTERVKLFNARSELFDSAAAKQFITSLGKPYSTILTEGQSKWPINETSKVLLTKFKGMMQSRRQTTKNIFHVNLLGV